MTKVLSIWIFQRHTNRELSCHKGRTPSIRLWHSGTNLEVWSQRFYEVPCWYSWLFQANISNIQSLTYDRKITIEDGGCATATVELRWVIPYYLTDYKLFNLQIGLRSLKKKERFIIRQLLNSLSGFTVIFVHDLKRKRRRKVLRQLKLCHIVALCSVKTLKISPILLSHLIFLSTHSHFPTYLQHCSKIWARCHQVKMNDWFSCTWITSPKNQIRSKL